MKLLSAVLLVVLATVIEAGKITVFQKCKMDDPLFSACLTKSANAGWPEFVKGDPKLHILPMNPLKGVTMNININDILKGTMSETSFAGLEDATFQSVDMDSDKKRIEVRFTVPTFNLNGHYEASGKILGREISGNGNENSTFHDVQFKYIIKYEIVKENDKEHIKIESSSLSMQAKKIDYYAENLFDGDKERGTTFLKFLNDNWDLTHEFTKGALGQAIGDTFSGVLSEFFKKVPVDELFA